MMTAGHKRDVNGNIIDGDNSRFAEHSHSPNDANSSKLTRRFACSFEGCSKAYTRAEHLSRHQLNHNPKDVFKCDFPGCIRTFVRQDLCVRHRERHDAPPGRSTEALSSEDEETEGGTRRVGRPRLSSLNRSTAFMKQDKQPHTASAHGVRQRVESNVNNTPSCSFSPTGTARSQRSPNPRPRQPGSPPTYPLSTNLTGNINGFSIDMLSSQSATAPTIGHYATHGDNDYALPALPEFNESPASIRDEFTAWLFDEQFSTAAAGPFFNTSMNAFGTLSNDFGSLGSNPMFTDYNQELLPQEIAYDSTASTSDFEITTSDDIAWISSSKRARLVDLMQSRFIDAENTDVTLLRHELFGQDVPTEEHVLSLRSMQLYLGSYWKHFHRQLPILHQPTFSADAADDLLVLAVMAIGASQLGTQHGRSKTTAASRFATFVAWHLRWQIFMHVDFRPPAKLWVFQTMLLLEIYEKANSTRQMHERAHVHSATMINLMRRGTTLIGDDETQRRTPGPSSPNDTWHKWIETESTRRAAFAAFVIDATHAVMFGHAAIMVVHEVRLPLPCDDALWSATSAAEVGRVHASLHTHGIKPTTFLDGLKRTLTGKKVRTNCFGRTILMAGLLSITWHLHQRDLQISSLGASSALGMPGIWREALAKSFDFWKRDFDESMSHMKSPSLPWQQMTSSEDRDACAAAGILHDLSHITLHIEILDCQIVTGAQKLFGRIISRADHDRAEHRMIEWVKTSAARNATFHAIQILKPMVMQTTSHANFYDTRADYLLNRGWACYYSLLVLWCYGYALDGMLRPFPERLLVNRTSKSPETNWLGQPANLTAETIFQARLDDARLYFNSVGNVRTPDDLRMLQSSRNRLVGLLGLFAESFSDSRWELLQESARRLEKAMQILRNGE